MVYQCPEFPISELVTLKGVSSALSETTPFRISILDAKAKVHVAVSGITYITFRQGIFKIRIICNWWGCQYPNRKYLVQE